jgi:hypothetical protein
MAQSQLSPGQIVGIWSGLFIAASPARSKNPRKVIKGGSHLHFTPE